MKNTLLHYVALVAIALNVITAPPAQAILLRVPDIPEPSLSLPTALKIAEKQLSDPEEFVLIAADWCKSSTFQPRVSDGTQYTPANDDPDSYSWFFTYVFSDKLLREDLDGTPLRSEYNSVLVIRIKDDGTIGVFLGHRT